MGNFTLDRVDQRTIDAILQISKNFTLSSYKDFNELLDLETTQKKKFLQLRSPLVDEKCLNQELKIADSLIQSKNDKFQDDV